MSSITDEVTPIHAPIPARLTAKRMLEARVLDAASEAERHAAATLQHTVMLRRFLPAIVAVIAGVAATIITLRVMAAAADELAGARAVLGSSIVVPAAAYALLRSTLTHRMRSATRQLRQARNTAFTATVELNALDQQLAGAAR
ncbi:hypothetical protein [Curtobacterium sp. MCBD17_040]|uniref:hypothetical protein n=1 Tax=Curtobacterium sp. MCBD17_040 TaxID=2175674 RepID=UPI0011B3AA84|nr:hypothetical protein [Curtobacterium sp. MCBD17_040]WIB65835.1 hypothetical protein DEI94_17120 [Curtobacterium sp. MCBD17_040]